MFKVLMCTAVLSAVTIVACDEVEPVPAPPTPEVWEVSYTLTGEAGAAGVADIRFTAPDKGWAAAADLILAYDGAGWTVAWDLSQVFPGWTISLQEVRVGSGGQIWAAGVSFSGSETAEVFHYDGATWEKFHVPGVGEYGLSCIQALGPDSVWAGGFDGLFYYNGSTWTEQLGEWVWSLYIAAADKGWTCGTNSATDCDNIYRFNGTNWTAEFSTPSPLIRFGELYFRNADEGWATAYDNGAYSENYGGTICHYNGGLWATEFGAVDDGFLLAACGFADNDLGWLGMHNGVVEGIYLYNGQDLKKYEIANDYYASAIWVNSRTDAWAGTGSHSGRAYLVKFKGFSS